MENGNNILTLVLVEGLLGKERSNRIKGIEREAMETVLSIFYTCIKGDALETLHVLAPLVVRPL